MYRLSHVTCVSLPLTADSVSFPDDLDYSFQHGLLNTTLVQSLDNTTSITLPPSQRPHLSSTVTVPADTSSRVPDKDDLLHCSTADLPLTANCEGFSILVEGSVLTTMREATLEVTTALYIEWTTIIMLINVVTSVYTLILWLLSLNHDCLSLSL